MIITAVPHPTSLLTLLNLSDRTEYHCKVSPDCMDDWFHASCCWKP